MSAFRFEIHAVDGAARLGSIHMPRGTIQTPAFMPVGTAATVKAMLPDSVRATGSEILLANTYHLMLRAGAQRIAQLGGLHKFMAWERPILTDSGGYQVMSLSALRTITEDGVQFRSHIDGSTHFLSPERAMEIQRLLGSDIQMVLDECLPLPADKDAIETSLALSMRWAKRSKAAFGVQPGRACFGIVQGGLSRSFAGAPPPSCARSDLTAMRWAGSRWARVRPRCSRRLRRQCPDFLPRLRTTSWASASRTTSWARSCAASTCSIACCRRARAEWPGLHGLGPLNLRNAQIRSDPRRSTSVPCAACRISAAPICTTWSRRGDHRLDAADLAQPRLSISSSWRNAAPQSRIQAWSLFCKNGPVRLRPEQDRHFENGVTRTRRGSRPSKGAGPAR